MRNRIELAQHFKDLGFKVGAEIGVYNGYFSEVLLQEIPDLKLYAIDPWENYHNYKWKSYTERLALAYETAKKKLAPYNCELIRKTSVDAAKDFADESLDFVFIDGNHKYHYVKEDLELWTPKVRKGGIVSGHDYYFTNEKNKGVIQAVDEFVKDKYELKLTDWYHESTVRDNRQPSWYFTK